MAVYELGIASLGFFKGLFESHLPVLLHVAGPAYGGVSHRSPQTGQITCYEPDNLFTPDTSASGDRRIDIIVVTYKHFSLGR